MVCLTETKFQFSACIRTAFRKNMKQWHIVTNHNLKLLGINWNHSTKHCECFGAFRHLHQTFVAYCLRFECNHPKSKGKQTLPQNQIMRKCQRCTMTNNIYHIWMCATTFSQSTNAIALVIIFHCLSYILTAWIFTFMLNLYFY